MSQLVNNQEEKLKYFLYARKSSEDEEKQILSIPAQKEEAEKRFPDLTVVEVFEEEKTAFKPGVRPVFKEMIKRIERGEARGIIAWHPNRLSRNEIDGGNVVYMLRTNQILDLKFCSYSFENSNEGIMMLQILFSQSQYESSKLSKDVKRGLDTKRKMGWMPGVAPAGYLNDKSGEKGMRTILTDPMRFPLLRKAWELMLTGSYTPPQILEILNKKWGFRTIKRKKEGGNPLSRSAIYKIFTNIFYAGVILHNDIEYPGKHKPMVTLEEFDRVQVLLGRKGKPRAKKHSFAFTGTLQCSHCGCYFTAERKLKYIKKDKKTRKYVYYHCTHHKKNIACTQRRSISKERLELMIESIIASHEILPEFREWALQSLRSSHTIETKTRNTIFKSLRREYDSLQHKEDILLNKLLSGLVDDNTYKLKIAELRRDKSKIEGNLRGTEKRAEKWLELTEKAFNFVTYAHQAFLKGDNQTKKEILIALGSNHSIKDGELTIETHEWLRPIEEKYFSLEKKYLKLEKSKTPMNKENKEALNSIRLAWRKGRDSNPRSR